MAITDPMNPAPRPPHEWERDLRNRPPSNERSGTHWGVWVLLAAILGVLVLVVWG